MPESLDELGLLGTRDPEANQSAARTEKENWVSDERKVVGAPAREEQDLNIARNRTKPNGPLDRAAGSEWQAGIRGVRGGQGEGG